MTISHFTLRRDPEVEQRLALCQDALARQITALPMSLRRHLAAVLLGGGYGCGEGGVAIRPEGRYPYNDLDLFVFTRGASRREQREINGALAEIGAHWSHELGIEIDFAAAREVKTLSRVASTMMFQALRAGNKMIYGDPEVLAGMPALRAEALPVREGLRLLLNRGSGMLLALERFRQGQTGAADADFIWRNWYKCVLGVGDALLVSAHAYSFVLPERVQRLEGVATELLTPENARQLSIWYAESVEFKAQPQIGALDEVRNRMAPLLQLWRDTLFAMLTQSTGTGVSSLSEARHALLQRRIFGGGVWWKNIILNLRYAPYRIVKEKLDTAPQLWLLAELAEILFENTSPWKYSNEPCSNVALERYLSLWRRFN